jgi:hypothetical protein
MSGDHFENLVRTLLEAEGFWVFQSFKVDLTTEDKRRIGRPSLPRPEIDLLAFRPRSNQIIAIEAKSYFDSRGVRLEELAASYEIPEGRFKLFTCPKFQTIVLQRLKAQLMSMGMSKDDTAIRLGLVFGNVVKRDVLPLRRYVKTREWFYWSPRLLKRKLRSQARRAYENNPVIIASKLIVR